MNEKAKDVQVQQTKGYNLRAEAEEAAQAVLDCHGYNSDGKLSWPGTFHIADMIEEVAIRHAARLQDNHISEKQLLRRIVNQRDRSCDELSNSLTAECQAHRETQTALDEARREIKALREYAERADKCAADLTWERDYYKGVVSSTRALPQRFTITITPEPA